MSASDSFLDREIREQPAAIARLLDRASEIARVAHALEGRQLRYAVIAARGTSDNAARYGQYLLGDRLGLPVALAAPSLESLYGARAVPHHGEGLVICISQSGRSPDIVAVARAAAAAGAPTIAITNDGGSPLAGAAGHVIELHAGPEESVAATKTYTTALAALAALVAEMRGGREDRAALQAVPFVVERVLQDTFVAAETLDRYADLRHVVAIGRGYNYGTATEIALKIRELTGAIGEGFSSADLLHGPIAALDPRDTLAIAVAVQGKARASVLETTEAVRARGVHAVFIADERDADLPLPSPLPEWLSPLVAIVPGQVLALRRAVLAGGSIDRPGGLSKVTETL
jgi:glutamine---fructose-6-phosphate transaminase (isomerizing)